MEIVSWGLLGIGTLALLVSGIWLLVVSFQKHILWGLACIFVPFASLVFLCMNWDRAAKPFLIYLVGLGLCAGGIFSNPTLMAQIKESANADSQVEAPR